MWNPSYNLWLIGETRAIFVVVCRCACAFGIVLLIFLILFKFPILNFVIFFSLHSGFSIGLYKYICTGSYLP